MDVEADVQAEVDLAQIGEVVVADDDRLEKPDGMDQTYWVNLNVDFKKYQAAWLKSREKGYRTVKKNEKKKNDEKQKVRDECLRWKKAHDGVTVLVNAVNVRADQHDQRFNQIDEGLRHIHELLQQGLTASSSPGGDVSLPPAVPVEVVDVATCMVCSETDEVKRLSCCGQHVCAACLMDVLVSKFAANCPNCRAALPFYSNEQMTMLQEIVLQAFPQVRGMYETPIVRQFIHLPRVWDARLGHAAFHLLTTGKFKAVVNPAWVNVDGSIAPLTHYCFPGDKLDQYIMAKFTGVWPARQTGLKLWLRDALAPAVYVFEDFVNGADPKCRVRLEHDSSIDNGEPRLYNIPCSGIASIKDLTPYEFESDVTDATHVVVRIPDGPLQCRKIHSLVHNVGPCVNVYTSTYSDEHGPITEIPFAATRVLEFVNFHATSTANLLVHHGHSSGPVYPITIRIDVKVPLPEDFANYADQINMLRGRNVSLLGYHSWGRTEYALIGFNNELYKIKCAFFARFTLPRQRQLTLF